MSHPALVWLLVSFGYDFETATYMGFMKYTEALKSRGSPGDRSIEQYRQLALRFREKGWA